MYYAETDEGIATNERYKDERLPLGETPLVFVFDDDLTILEAAPRAGRSFTSPIV